MLSSLYAKLAAIGGVILAILAALGMARRSGAKAEQQKELETSLKQAKESNEIDDTVRRMDDSVLDKRLRDFQRKD